MRPFHRALFGRFRRRHNPPPRTPCPPLLRRLEIEALDQRIVPSVTAVPSGSTLLVIGDDNSDVASVRLLGPGGSNSIVLAVYNNSDGSGAPISTPVLTSFVPQVPVLSVAAIQFNPEVNVASLGHVVRIARF